MRRPLLAAIVLAALLAAGCAKAGLVGDSGPNAVGPAPAGSVDDATLDSGDLTLTPHVADAASCALLFRGGELVDVTGDGFAQSGRVTVTVMPQTPEAVAQVVSSDSSGHIAVTVTLPKKLKGPKVGGDQLGYVEADGPGATSTNQSDNAIFNIGSGSANCGATPTSGGVVTVILAGSDGPEVPTGGAVFAITGPGLPPIVGATGGSGQFAELDTSADETTVCPAKEPAGTHCADGSIDRLRIGQTYTATEVKPPAHFAGAAPQTFTAVAGDESGLYFFDAYLGPAPPARLTVSVTTNDSSVSLPAGAVFAVTGPGLPALRSNEPAAGTVAEIDATAYDSVACANAEPKGVNCDEGELMDLSPGAVYTVTELIPPPGYAISPPQTATTQSDGSPTVVSFTVAATG
jgi:hypothetical protein